MTIASTILALKQCDDLHDYQEKEILEYVKARHTAYYGIARAMLAKYKASKPADRVKLVSSLSKYFPNP